MGQPSRPIRFNVSTHSRLKAAGVGVTIEGMNCIVSTHSRLKAAGMLQRLPLLAILFQHTAA